MKRLTEVAATCLISHMYPDPHVGTINLVEWVTLYWYITVSSIHRPVCSDPLPSSSVPLHQHHTVLVKGPEVLQRALHWPGHRLWRRGHETDAGCDTGVKRRIYRDGLDRSPPQQLEETKVIFRRTILQRKRRLHGMGLWWTWQLLWRQAVCDDAEWRSVGPLQVLPEISLHLLWRSLIHFFPLCFKPADVELRFMNFFLCLFVSSGTSQRFIFVEQEMSWFDAVLYCRKLYTDLASVRNKEENQEIQQLAKNSSVWIGLFRSGKYDIFQTV